VNNTPINMNIGCNNTYFTSEHFRQNLGDKPSRYKVKHRCWLESIYPAYYLSHPAAPPVTITIKFYP